MAGQSAGVPGACAVTKFVGAIHVDAKILDGLDAKVKSNAQRLVAASAFRVSQTAIMMAPIDLGALKSSIFVKTSVSSNFAGAVKNAEALRPGVRTEDSPGIDSPYQAHVVAPVEYALFQELGTSRMAAHPYMVPAVEAERAAFMAQWKELFK